MAKSHNPLFFYASGCCGSFWGKENCYRFSGYRTLPNWAASPFLDAVKKVSKHSQKMRNDKTAHAGSSYPLLRVSLETRGLSSFFFSLARHRDAYSSVFSPNCFESHSADFGQLLMRQGTFWSASWRAFCLCRRLRPYSRFCQFGRNQGCISVISFRCSAEGMGHKEYRRAQAMLLPASRGSFWGRAMTAVLNIHWPDSAWISRVSSPRYPSSSSAGAVHGAREPDTLSRKKTTAEFHERVEGA